MRRSRVLAAVVLALAAASARADPCAAVSEGVTSDDFATLRTRLQASLRAEPETAIVVACREAKVARDANDRMQARIDLGAALHQASRDDEAIAELDAVLAMPGLPGRSMSEARLRRGQAWVASREMAKAGEDFAAAEAELDPDGPLFAELLIGSASVKQGALDLDGADRDLDAAAALLARLGLARQREGADLYNQRTMVAYARQDFAATIRNAEAELSVTREVGGPDDREQLDALATLGAVKSMTGDFAGAEAALREGLRIAEVRDDGSVDARIGLLLNLATFHLDRVEPEQALPYVERATALATRTYASDGPPWMRVLLTQASVDAELSRFAEARAAYDRAAAIDAAHASAFPALQRARLHLRRAQLDLKLGDREAVRADLATSQAVMGDRPGLDYWRGWQARIACRLAAGEGDWVAADARCADAIARFAGVLPPDHPLVVEAVVGRCYAQVRGGLPGDACDRVDERLRREPAGHPVVRVVALEALALREVSRGHRDAALDLRVRMVAAASGLSTPDPLWAARFALARSLADAGDRRLAILFAKQAVDAIEDMRASLAADRERLERGFLADKLAVHRQLAAWLLAEGRAPEALEVLRLLKREEAYDFAERPVERATVDATEGRVPYGDHEAMLLRRLGDPSASRDADEIARLSRLRDAKKLSADEAARLSRLTADDAAREQARSDDLRRFLAEAHREVPPTQAGPVGPRPKLAADEGDAYFFVADARLQFVFVHRDGIDRRATSIAAEMLDRRVGDFLAGIANRDASARRAAATDLSAWLAAPLDRAAREHGVRRIRLWLDGALRYVPFAALTDGSRYLVERYEFSYLAAGGPPVVVPSERGAHRLVAFGVTRALAGMPALPGVGEELCGIVDGPVAGLDGENAPCAATGDAHGALAGVGYANAAFTEARLRTFATAGPTRPDLLHVGTHFALRPGNMGRSWLLVGDGSRLSLAAFTGLGFDGVDLVTLSACETGMAGAVSDDGREVEGLPGLLLGRGAGAVVSTLWRVEDRGAGRLMRRFYAALARPGVRSADALRRAQLATLREGGSRPEDWAAFVASVRAP